MPRRSNCGLLRHRIVRRYLSETNTNKSEIEVYIVTGSEGLGPSCDVASTCKKKTDKEKYHVTRSAHGAHEMSKMSDAHDDRSMSRMSKTRFMNIYKSSKFFLNFVFNSINQFRF